MSPSLGTPLVRLRLPCSSLGCKRPFFVLVTRASLFLSLSVMTALPVYKSLEGSNCALFVVFYICGARR